MNYPIYDSGNKFCSGLDLSSAYVTNNNADELIIKVTHVTFSFTDDTAVDYDKATSKSYTSCPAPSFAFCFTSESLLIHY